jgi:hypothetical protein
MKTQLSLKTNPIISRYRTVHLAASNFLFDNSLITKEIRLEKQMWVESIAFKVYPIFENSAQHKIRTSIADMEGAQLLASSFRASDSDFPIKNPSFALASLRMKDMYKIITLMFNPRHAGVEMEALHRPIWIDLGSGDGFPTFVASMLHRTIAFGYEHVPLRKEAAERIFEKMTRRINEDKYYKEFQSVLKESLRNIHFGVGDISAPGTWQNVPNEIAVFCFDARMSDSVIKSVFHDMENHKYSSCLVSNAPLKKVRHLD